MAETSPRITRISWGRVQVAGNERPFRDAKLYPGGAREWDWRETGTNHSPGIQPADVRELLDHGARVVILSTGVHGNLGVTPEARALLEEKKITLHVRPTPDAVRLYNDLTETEAVGALIHSTC